jgi:hypothetical protein
VSQKLLDYDLTNIVDAAMKHAVVTFDQNYLIKYLSSHITYEHHWLPSKKHELSNYVKNLIVNAEKDFNSRRTSNYNIEFPTTQMIFKKISNSLLTLTYIGCKMLFLINGIVQILIMNMFLSNEKHEYYGGQIIRTIWRGEADLGERNDSKIFPRITICDVKTKELGTNHLYTVQCVLAYNLFNERIYSFLWFWIFIVIIPLTIIDLIKWIQRFFIFGSYYRYKFIRDRVRIYDQKTGRKEKFLIKLFCEYYMGNDGIHKIIL